MSLQPLGHASRVFRRSPGVFCLIVLALALGIGGTTAVFGVVDALIVHPVPYRDAAELLEVWTDQTPTGRRVPGLENAVFQGLRDQRELFSSVEAYQMGAATLTGDGEPALVAGPRLSPGLLRMLGVVPRLGRLFDDGDVVPGIRVALISEHLWASRFGRATHVIGRRLIIDAEPHTIIGVLPSGFAFPEQRAEVWRPIVVGANGSSGRVSTVARIHTDPSHRASVDDRLKIASNRLQQAGILGKNQRLVSMDLVQRRYGRQYSSALVTMLGAVGLVLLIACVNVSNLLLARAAARQQEFALMGALGASRGRLIRGVLIESLLLASAGGIAGVAVARVLLVLLFDLLPPQFTMLAAAATLNWRVLAFTVGVSTLTCLTVGLLPALRIARIDAIQGLRGRARGVLERGDPWQSGLVVAELALVVVLMTGAGLLLRGFVRLVNVDLGFDPAHLLVFEIQLPEGRSRAPGSSVRLFEQLNLLVMKQPGVARSAYSEGAPPTNGSFSFDIQPEADGRGRIDAAGLVLHHSNVSPEYFATMGIALADGRAFAKDDTDDVVIVSDVLARRFWGHESPIGRRFRLDIDQPWHTVVGVATHVRQSGMRNPMDDEMELYFPYKRDDIARFFSLIVRSNGDPAPIVQHVKDSLWSLDAGIPIIDASTMDHRLIESVARPRFFLRLTSAFAGIAIVLACVGVYGTAAYWIARRRQEIGIRLALGASRQRVLGLVLGRSARLAAWGCVIGVMAALAVTRVLTSLLFETSPRDPEILMGTTVLLMALVMVACYLPALRASRLDPAVVLRAD